jgi:hypothetical protein
MSSITTLINRAYNLSSSYKIFHDEVSFLKNYFVKNYYPTKLFNSSLNKFLNSKYTHSTKSFDVPRLPIFLQLPYIGSQTKHMRADVLKLLNRFYPQLKPNFYFKSGQTIGSFFRVKDTTTTMMRASVVYKYTCDSCQLSYIGSTALQMFIRSAQHMGVSYRTNLNLSKPQKSSIRDHCNNSKHNFNSDNFSILSSTFYPTDLRILESMYIYKDRPPLNEYSSAIKLYMM